MFCERETEVRRVKGKITGMKSLLDKNNTSQICRCKVFLVQCLFLKYRALKFCLIYVENCF